MRWLRRLNIRVHGLRVAWRLCSLMAWFGLDIGRLSGLNRAVVGLVLMLKLNMIPRFRLNLGRTRLVCSRVELYILINCHGWS